MAEGSILRQMGRIITALGVVSSASSVISLIQHIGNISLVGAFGDFVRLYRDIAHPLVDFLPGLFRLHPPLLLKDLWTLSALLTILFWRALDRDREKVEILFILKRDDIYVYFFLCLACGFLTYTLIGLFLPLLLIFQVFNPLDALIFQDTKALDDLRGFIGQLLIAILATVVFFILNAFVGYMR